MKYCPACNLTKGEKDFHKNKLKPDGLQSKCKLCATAEARERYRTKDAVRKAQYRKDNKYRIRKLNKKHNTIAMIERRVNKGMHPLIIAKEVKMEWPHFCKFCEDNKIKLDTEVVEQIKKVRGLVRKDGNQYRALTFTWINITKSQLSLGNFDTQERASIAARLWKYWYEQGYNPFTIPRAPQQGNLCRYPTKFKLVEGK